MACVGVWRGSRCVCVCSCGCRAVSMDLSPTPPQAKETEKQELLAMATELMARLEREGLALD